jgi:hypothetical protein
MKGSRHEVSGVIIKPLLGRVPRSPGGELADEGSPDPLDSMMRGARGRCQGWYRQDGTGGIRPAPDLGVLRRERRGAHRSRAGTPDDARVTRYWAKGRTLVLALHQLTDPECVCERFVLLADGSVRGIGTLDELRARIGNSTASLEEVCLGLV